MNTNQDPPPEPVSRPGEPPPDDEHNRELLTAYDAGCRSPACVDTHRARVMESARIAARRTLLEVLAAEPDTLEPGERSITETLARLIEEKTKPGTPPVDLGRLARITN